MKTVKIRGHHLHLLLFENSVPNLPNLRHNNLYLDKFLRGVPNNPNSKIELVAGYDDICSYCEKKERGCDNKINEILIKKDILYMSKYGLKLNSIYSLSELMELLANKTK